MKLLVFKHHCSVINRRLIKGIQLTVIQPFPAMTSLQKVNCSDHKCNKCISIMISHHKIQITVWYVNHLFKSQSLIRQLLQILNCIEGCTYLAGYVYRICVLTLYLKNYEKKINTEASNHLKFFFNRSKYRSFNQSSWCL